jgi:3-(methylthio)propanoyl-CoA dehydrogenase
MDNARRHPDADARKEHQAFVDLMIPIIKGHSTEVAQEVASLGLQVHGGMGFIEETGAAQHFRDARITTIYEGTTGIQANDLVGRKTMRDGGALARKVAAEIEGCAQELLAHTAMPLKEIGAGLTEATQALEAVIDWMVPAYGKQPRAVHAGSVPYLRLWGLVVGGWQMGRAALIATKHLGHATGDAHFYNAKIATARFYANCLLPQASGLARGIIGGGESALSLTADQF